MNSNKKRISVSKKIKNNPYLIDSFSVDDLIEIYPELSGYDYENIKKILFLFSTDNNYKKILKYIKICPIEYFSFEGYLNYEQYKKTNTKDTSSLDYLIALYNNEKYANEKFNNRIKFKKNCYDPKYISERENISIEDAEKYIEKYKKNKSTSLESFIKRHGEEKGKEKFKKFQKTSSLSSDYNFWLSSYSGNNPEKDWQYEMRRKSKRCVEYWTHTYNISIEEAKDMVSFHQKTNSGVHKDFYRAKGYTENEIDEIFSDINSRRDGCSLKGIREKYPNLNEEEILDLYEERCAKKSKNPSPETLLKIRDTLEKNGHWTPIEFLSGYEKYKREVWSITNKQKIEILDNYNKRNRSGVKGAYQLDHKFSVKSGFINDIEPNIIGSIHNLEFIPWEENIKKFTKCSITKEELERLYYNEN